MRSVKAIFALTARDPVLEIIRVTRRDRWWLCLSFVFVASAHAALGWLVSQRFATRPQPGTAIATELFDVELLPPTKEKILPESRPEVAPVAAAPAPRAAKETRPRSELAQAATVVMAPDDSPDPVDLTGFVVGTATSFAGGTTASTGTSTRAVIASAADTAGEKGPAKKDDAIAVDRSRPPAVVGDLNWNCPFPLEADSERIDSAVVVIRVTVDAADRVTDVDVLQNPSHGFAEAARRCALNKSWRAARNREGLPVAGSVTVRVRFIR